MEQQKGNETAGRGGAGTDSLDAETACHGDAEQVGKTHKVVPKRVSLKLWEEKKGILEIFKAEQETAAEDELHETAAVAQSVERHCPCKEENGRPAAKGVGYGFDGLHGK